MKSINCDCTVTFENGRKRIFSCGKLRSFALQNMRQDVWSKREWEAPEPGTGAGELHFLSGNQVGSGELRTISAEKAVYAARTATAARSNCPPSPVTAHGHCPAENDSMCVYAGLVTALLPD